MKRRLQKSRVIKLLTRARWSQSHTNNGFFKLVEALLQIYSCFFSHSIKLCEAYRYQQCHCLAAKPAKMFVFNSHMQGFHSVISNKPRLHTKKTYSYNKNPKSLGCEQKHMSGFIWIETIIEYWFNYTVVPLPNFFCTATTNNNIWTTFLLLKTFFITLVTYYPLMISLTNCSNTIVIKLGNFV